MKKTLTTFFACAALSLGINAQTTTWSFETLTDGIITGNTEINGLIINANKQWTVEGSSKTFGSDQYTKRLKSGGGDRSLSFPVTGPGAIEIAALSSSTSEPERAFVIDGTTLTTKAEGAESSEYIIFEYKGPAATLTLTTNAGINFYAIKYTPNGEAPVLSNKTWSMSDFTTGTISAFTETYTNNGLIVYPGAEGNSPMNMTFEPSGKDFDIDGTKTRFTERLKANGDSKIDAVTGIPTARILKFKPTSDGKIYVGALTGSTNADRNVLISKYNAGTITNLLTYNTNIVAGANGLAPAITDYTYTAGDEIWIYGDNNIQYYFVRFTGTADPEFEGELSGITNTAIESAPEIIIANGEIQTSEAAGIEIFAISGIKVLDQKNATVISTQDLESGVYIVKCTSSKGKVATKKFVK